MHCDGVETVVDRDVAGERVINAFLRLNRYDRTPAGQHRNYVTSANCLFPRYFPLRACK